MVSKAVTFAGASVLLAPIAVTIGDELQLTAWPPGETGLVSEYGVEQAMADLAAVEANRGAFEAASWCYYAAAVLTIPALVILWRLAVNRSSGWAWAGAALGACSVVGQFVYLLSWFGVSQVFSAQPDLRVPAEILVDWQDNTFSMAVFAPYLIGTILAPAVQAVALKRARVIPLWALLAVLAATLVLAAIGSAPVATAVWGALMVAGFAPAAMAAMTGRIDLAHGLPVRRERHGMVSP